MLNQDDPNTGRKELEAVVAGQPRAVFIGITCGISAPYVLGQVEWAMRQPQCVHGRGAGRLRLLSKVFRRVARVCLASRDA